MLSSQPTLNTLFDAIYVVSLPSSIARRASIREQFVRLGVEHYHLVDAIDGNTLDLAALKSQDILQNEKLSPGEIGCYLTHIQVYRDILQAEHKTALICEDDIVFSPNATELFSDYMQRMPPDWDILHFHSLHPVGNDSKRDKGRILIKEGIYQGYDEGRGTLCLALRPRCIRYLLDLAFPIKTAFDGITAWPTGWWTHGYRGYIVSLFPCSIGPFKNEMAQRGKRFQFRISDSLRSQIQQALQKSH
jgi:GR25 family glycosyltransferase involved in LPS biosynthesis